MMLDVAGGIIIAAVVLGLFAGGFASLSEGSSGCGLALVCFLAGTVALGGIFLIHTGYVDISPLLVRHSHAH